MQITSTGKETGIWLTDTMTFVERQTKLKAIESSWDLVKPYVDSAHIPIFVFWGSCGKCNAYRKSVLEKDEFVKFMQSDGKDYMYFFESEDLTYIKSFAQGSGRQYPFIKGYWKQASGQIIAQDFSRGIAYSDSPPSPSTVINQIKTLFKDYVPGQSTSMRLSYDPNGGTGSIDPVTVTDAREIQLSEQKFQKSDQTQTGWKIEDKVYQFGAKYTITKDVTAYAVWQNSKPDENPVTDPTQPDVKEYDIPSFDSSGIKIKGYSTAVSINKFPYHYRYKSSGRKYIRMSDNISALTLRGKQLNGIETQIKAAYLNKNIPEISPSCFANCTMLSAINADNNIRIVDEYAFYNCQSLRGLSFLDQNNKSLRRIGDYAFAKSGLESIKINLIPSVSETASHSYCFASCYNLEQAEFCHSTYLGEHMFDGCRSLKTVKFNNNHSYVHGYAFANCISLSKIVLPPKMYMLSPHMFDGCVNLTRVIFESPSDLRQLSEGVFANCPKLTSITLPESVDSLSYIDPLFLSASSISRVEFKGIPDEYLAQETYISRELKYKTGEIHKTELKNVLDCAMENNIPVIAWLGEGYNKGCTRCDNFYNNIEVPMTEWFKTTGYFYLAGENNINKSEYGDLAAYICSTIGLDTPGTYVWLYLFWKKPDGTLVKWTSESISPDASYQNILKSKAAELFNGYIPGQTKEIEYKIKETITTFGRGPGLSVTYISNTGKEYVCGNDSITYVPEVKVDKDTTDNFKYGIWYYNAKQLREYADEHNLPVMLEYSSAACDPCVYFRKAIYNDQSFQNTIRKKPCLLCRVETVKGEYFDHPPTTQAYYAANIWNKKNTLPPVILYYWKKSETETYEVDWNCNYRTDPSNANSETVLRKLDEMLGDYQGEAAYYPPDITKSQNGKYQFYQNQTDDLKGVYFVCDVKHPIQRYDGQLSIDVRDDMSEPVLTNGRNALRAYAGSASSGTKTVVLDGIRLNEELPDIPPYTYQYFTTTGEDSQYNTNGIIFQVNEQKVQYLYEFSNENSEIPDPREDEKYKRGTKYVCSTKTGFDEILGQCRTNSIVMILLESGITGTEFDDLMDSSAFRLWLKNSEYIFVEARLDDWSTELGVTVRNFESQTEFYGNSATDPLPKILVYHGCSSCTLDGSIEIYCRQKIEILDGKDISYYTQLIDQYASL